MTSCTTEKETASESNGLRMFWTNKQTKVLVHAWRKNVKVIESHQSLMGWNAIKEHVSKHGQKKQSINVKRS